MAGREADLSNNKEKNIMATIDNLKNAFAGESQANRKYLAFAKKADQDQLPGVARLFRAAAHAETVHAHAHLRAMGGIHDTQANLQEAVGGETFEFTKMYPPYVEEAKKEGHAAAERSFAFAMTVKKTHADLYTRAELGQGRQRHRRPDVLRLPSVRTHGRGPPSGPMPGVRLAEVGRDRLTPCGTFEVTGYTLQVVAKRATCNL